MNATEAKQNNHTTFKYLGYILAEDKIADNNIVNRLSAGWIKWQTLSRVLCDRKIRTKVNIYKGQ